MKKIFVSLFLVVAVVVYVAYQRGLLVFLGNPTNKNEYVVINKQNTNSPGNTKITNSSNPIVGRYKDGVYTGDVVDAYFGNVQVRTTIQGGKLVDVEFLQYPTDRSHSRELSLVAMPRLKTEAIKAQSNQVDIVSGATQTSEAFQKSLATALAQA